MKTIFSIFTFCFILSGFSQKATIELSFTAENFGQNVLLDSIKILNLTSGGDTLLYAPDTILVLDYMTNVEDFSGNWEKNFFVAQNYPNPFSENTSIEIFIPEKDLLIISISDLTGKELVQYHNTLNPGKHSFSFYPGNSNQYILSVNTKSETKAIKMANLDRSGHSLCKLVYNGNTGFPLHFKSAKEITSFVYSLGDELQYTAFTIHGESEISDAPSSSQLYTFLYEAYTPCPGLSSITYEDQVYNTILIGEQCWLKESMNVGLMIDGSMESEDNDIIEKYCYDNLISNCDIYGAFYQWNEMMQYSTTPGVQGICPPEWHLPSDDDWNILFDFLGGDTIAGGKMKATGTIETNTGLWHSPNTGATNESGYTALPGGYRGFDGNFYSLNYVQHFASSTESGASSAYHKKLGNNYAEVQQGNVTKDNGNHVRCLKD